MSCLACFEFTSFASIFVKRDLLPNTVLQGCRALSRTWAFARPKIENTFLFVFCLFLMLVCTTSFPECESSQTDLSVEEDVRF